MRENDLVKGYVRIDASTKRSLSFLAIPATTICDVKRHHDSVAFLEAIGYFASNFFNNARVVTSNLVEDQIIFSLWDHCLISSGKLTLSPPLVK